MYCNCSCYDSNYFRYVAQSIGVKQNIVTEVGIAKHQIHNGVLEVPQFEYGTQSFSSSVLKSSLGLDLAVRKNTYYLLSS